jgi:hypothetical protein
MSVLVERSELGQIAVGLLEVIAEDLLVLSHPLSGGPLEPACETLVQLRPKLFRKRVVSSVANE